MEIFSWDSIERAFQLSCNGCRKYPQGLPPVQTLGPARRGKVRLMVKKQQQRTSSFQDVWKGRRVAPSRLCWFPVRLKEWNAASPQTKRMEKEILSVGKLIPGRPQSVKSPVGFSAWYLLKASPWWSIRDTTETGGIPAGPQVQGAFPTRDGSTSPRLEQRLAFPAATFPPLKRFLFLLNFNQLCYIFCPQKTEIGSLFSL